MNANGQGALVVLLVLMVIYFLPTIIAKSRHVENANPTFIVNLFLGWTLIGWVVALAMGAGGQTKPMTKDALGRDFSRTKACPKCAEQIQRAATVCRFCQHRLEP